MKKQGAIKKKLKQVKYRLLQKFIRNNTSKKPCNCSHSGLVKGHSNDPIFYVCLLDASKPKKWDGVVCDPSMPNNCPFFTSHKKEDDLKESFSADFDSLINEGDMGKIASKYPDVAALLWVLAEDLDPQEEEEDD